jgi:hypothetical protein
MTLYKYIIIISEKGMEAIFHTGCGNKLFYLAKEKVIIYSII